MKHKHIRLFSFLIASVSLLALSACETSARYSEHFDWEGTLTQENKTEESVTIKFKLTYGSAIELPNYATLWVEGSWLGDTTEGWNSTLQSLSYNTSTQSYNLELTNVEHGEYKYQLVLGYTHLNEPHWDYQLTDKDNAPTFTINSEVTEVTINLTSSIEKFMPAYTETLSNYTLKFTFTYNGQKQSIPDYASVYIYGSWDNPTDADWTVYHELTLDSDGYTYYYTIPSIDALADGSEWYHYSIVLGYSELGHPDWDYTLVNSEGLNITGYETDNYIDIPITLSESLETTIPEITALTNYTLTFAFTYNGSSISAPEYVSVYYLGGLVGEPWGDSIELTAKGDGTYTLTFESINVGTYEYALMIDYSGQSGVTWTEGQIITSSNQTFTVSVGQGNDYVSDTITIASEIDISSLLPDVVFTYVITFYHNGTKLDPAGDGIELYAAGDYDIDEYSQWTTTKLENNGDGTYNLVVHFIPENDKSFNIYVNDTADDNQDMWSYILGTYTISGISDTGTGVFTHEISIDSSYSSIDDLLHPTGTNFYIVVLNSDSGNSSLSSKFTTLHFQDESWNDEHTFDGSATSSLTSTTTGGGQGAIYNTTVGVAEPGSTHNAYLYTLSGNQWANQVNISITIPETSDGTIAVYLCDYDASGSSTSVSTRLSDGTDGGWVTGINVSISEYVASLEDHRAAEESTTEFYMVILNQAWSYSYSSLTFTTSNGTTENLFNGSSSSSLGNKSISATDSWSTNTYYCMYNTTGATAEPNTTHTAQFTGSSSGQGQGGQGGQGGSGTTSTFSISGLTIPAVSSGEIAVYLCYFDSSSNSPTAYTDIVFGNSAITGGWNYYSGTIDNFMSYLDSQTSMSWS